MGKIGGYLGGDFFGIGRELSRNEKRERSGKEGGKGREGKDGRKEGKRNGKGKFYRLNE